MGFTLYHSTSSLVPEITKLIKFVYCHTNYKLWQSKCRSFPGENDPFLVPSMLMELALEDCSNHIYEVPAIMLYCIMRLFQVQDGHLIIMECGYTGSILASILYLLRAGACSCMLSRGNSNSIYSMDIASKMKTSDAVQLISQSV